MKLDEAIKVAEADLAEGGFFGAEHLARVQKELATLRALKMAQTGLRRAWYTDELGDKCCASSYRCELDSDGPRHHESCAVGQAIAAIAALYPEASDA